MSFSLMVPKASVATLMVQHLTGLGLVVRVITQTRKRKRKHPGAPGSVAAGVAGVASLGALGVAFLEDSNLNFFQGKSHLDAPGAAVVAGAL